MRAGHVGHSPEGALPAMSAHLLVGADWDCHERRRQIARVVRDRYAIDHSTLQLDHPTTRPLNS